MSLATIVKKIDDEAEAHVQKLLDQARAEGEKILTHGRAEAQIEVEQILRQAERELQNFNTKQKATTLLQARKHKLDNRQHMLDDVFAQALARVRACEPDQYKAILTRMLLAVSEEQPARIRIAEPDRDLITQAFLDEINYELARQQRALHFQLAPETAAIEKGCTLDFDDFEMNFSFEALLAETWEPLKSQVSRQLFGDDTH